MVNANRSKPPFFSRRFRIVLGPQIATVARRSPVTLHEQLLATPPSPMMNTLRWLATPLTLWIVRQEQQHRRQIFCVLLATNIALWIGELATTLRFGFLLRRTDAPCSGDGEPECGTGFACGFHVVNPALLNVLLISLKVTPSSLAQALIVCVFPSRLSLDATPKITISGSSFIFIRNKGPIRTVLWARHQCPI